MTNGRAGEASAERRYSTAGATNFAALPGARRGEKYASSAPLPPVPWRGDPNAVRYELIHADCRDVMANMGDNSVDSVVCDPPYELTSITKRFGANNAAPAKFGTDGSFARLSGGFMGMRWDSTGIAFDPALWAEVLRVLKPGGHLVAFSGTRTYHRMAVAIEDAGFEIRDMLSWLYGSGFPKSLDIGKAIDKAAGALGTQSAGFNAAGTGAGYASNGGSAFRSDHPDYVPYAPATPEAQQWDGWGTALKPACEPICFARKPLVGTVAANVLAWGTGGINIDGCRVPTEGETTGGSGRPKSGTAAYGDFAGNGGNRTPDAGRFPANVLHDGSDEVVALFPDTTSGGGPAAGTPRTRVGVYGEPTVSQSPPLGSNSGSAARFFYCAKASKRDREEGCGALPLGAAGMTSENSGQHITRREEGYEPPQRANTHPTVKPTDLMRWLCRAITPPGGLVFDPFTGSGSTGKAAMLEGFRFIGAEMTDEYIPIARARIEYGLTSAS